jgi:hypothetical protein
MECTKLKHRIGNGSPYDADMDLIESYVKYANNPNDIMIMTELKTYFTSRALHYWNKLEEMYEESEDKNKENMDFDYVKDNFLELLDLLNDNFNMVDVIGLFIFLGSINCRLFGHSFDYVDKIFNSREEELGYIIRSGRVFPILNLNGTFAFNTWLYAYFEDVDLVGFVPKDVVFDAQIGCSLDLYYHDLAHISRINTLYMGSRKIIDEMEYKSSFTDKYGEDKKLMMGYNFKNYKNIYYNILNSDTLSSRYKELYILVLWMFIHEEFLFKDLGDGFRQTIKFMADTLDKGYGFFYEIGNEFAKYSDILLSKDIIDKNKYFLLNNLSYDNKRVFEEYLDGKISYLTDVIYIYLGTVYVLKDIHNNYEYYTSPIACY